MLVLHPGALGDVLLSIPALRALRAAEASEEIVLAAQPQIGRLLTSLGVVDRCLAFDTLGIETLFIPIIEGLGSPRERGSPHRADEPSARLRALVAGARVVSWFGARDRLFALRLAALAPGAVVAAPHVPGVETWRHLLESVAPLIGDGVGSREPVEVPAALVAEGRALLRDAGSRGARRLVMLHPGAGSVAKCWAPEGFAALARRLVEAADVEIIVHEGPADRDAVAALRADLRAPALVLREPALEVLAGALRHVALWIGNDSGASHLAASVGARALVLFTEANLAWRPWSRETRTLVVSTDALAPADVHAVIATATALLEAQRPVGTETIR
jgi:ADP-heptose:LPS heptosyltransferase